MSAADRDEGQGAAPGGAGKPPAARKRWSGETKRKLAVTILVVLSLGFGTAALGLAWGQAHTRLDDVRGQVRLVEEVTPGMREQRAERLDHTLREYHQAEQLRAYLLLAGLILAYGALALSIVGGSLQGWLRRRAEREAEQLHGAP